MAATYRRVSIPGRARKSLLIRGGAARTFGSLVAFLATLMLAVGAYLLAEMIAHPLEGETSETIGAAVLIALAAVMIFYLVEPRATARLRRRRALKCQPPRTATLHLPLTPKQGNLFKTARVARGRASFEPSYEFTLKLSESPRDSVLQVDGDDAVHGRR